jgi:hypothetical protein
MSAINRLLITRLTHGLLNTLEYTQILTVMRREGLNFYSHGIVNPGMLAHNLTDKYYPIILTESRYKIMYNKLVEAYNKGYSDGFYGFTYLNPYYSAEELNEWSIGFKAGQEAALKNKS